MPNEESVKTSLPEPALADKVMEKIHTEKTEMKPKWHFVVGSLMLFSGVALFLSLSVYLVSFISFFFRSHGPRAEMRLNMLLAAFPWWALLLALLGIGLGVTLLRQYDFSYKRHFWPAIAGLVLAIFAAGFIMNYFGLDRPLMKQGPMRGMYERYDGKRGMMKDYREGRGGKREGYQDGRGMMGDDWPMRRDR